MKYHLRHIGARLSRPECAEIMDFIHHTTIIGRNPAQCDHIISSANFVQNAIVSRKHAFVYRQQNGEHRIRDESRNGIFINDIKMQLGRAGETVLTEGDTVTFGHRNGENMLAGVRARQPNSEFQYIFEVCECSGENLPRRPCSATRQSRSVCRGTGMDVEQDERVFRVPLSPGLNMRTLSSATARGSRSISPVPRGFGPGSRHRTLSPTGRNDRSTSMLAHSAMSSLDQSDNIGRTDSPWNQQNYPQDHDEQPEEFVSLEERVRNATHQLSDVLGEALRTAREAQRSPGLSPGQLRPAPRRPLQDTSNVNIQQSGNNVNKHLKGLTGSNLETASITGDLVPRVVANAVLPSSSCQLVSGNGTGSKDGAVLDLTQNTNSPTPAISRNSLVSMSQIFEDTDQPLDLSNSPYKVVSQLKDLTNKVGSMKVQHANRNVYNIDENTEDNSWQGASHSEENIPMATAVINTDTSGVVSCPGATNTVDKNVDRKINGEKIYSHVENCQRSDLEERLDAIVKDREASDGTIHNDVQENMLQSNAPMEGGVMSRAADLAADHLEKEPFPIATNTVGVDIANDTQAGPEKNVDHKCECDSNDTDNDVAENMIPRPVEQNIPILAANLGTHTSSVEPLPGVSNRSIYQEISSQNNCSNLGESAGRIVNATKNACDEKDKRISSHGVTGNTDLAETKDNVEENAENFYFSDSAKDSKTHIDIPQNVESVESKPIKSPEVIESEYGCETSLTDESEHRNTCIPFVAANNVDIDQKRDSHDGSNNARSEVNLKVLHRPALDTSADKVNIIGGASGKNEAGEIVPCDTDNKDCTDNNICRDVRLSDSNVDEITKLLPNIDTALEQETSVKESIVSEIRCQAENTRENKAQVATSTEEVVPIIPCVGKDISDANSSPGSQIPDKDLHQLEDSPCGAIPVQNCSQIENTAQKAYQSVIVPAVCEGESVFKCPGEEFVSANKNQELDSNQEIDSPALINDGCDPVKSDGDVDVDENHMVSASSLTTNVQLPARHADIDCVDDTGLIKKVNSNQTEVIETGNENVSVHVEEVSVSTMEPTNAPLVDNKESAINECDVTATDINTDLITSQSSEQKGDSDTDTECDIVQKRNGLQSVGSSGDETICDIDLVLATTSDATCCPREEEIVPFADLSEHDTITVSQDGDEQERSDSITDTILLSSQSEGEEEMCPDNADSTAETTVLSEPESEENDSQTTLNDVDVEVNEVLKITQDIPSELDLEEAAKSPVFEGKKRKRESLSTSTPWKISDKDSSEDEKERKRLQTHEICEEKESVENIEVCDNQQNLNQSHRSPVIKVAVSTIKEAIQINMGMTVITLEKSADEVHETKDPKHPAEIDTESEVLLSDRIELRHDGSMGFTCDNSLVETDLNEMGNTENGEEFVYLEKVNKSLPDNNDTFVPEGMSSVQALDMVTNPYLKLMRNENKGSFEKSDNVQQSEIVPHNPRDQGILNCPQSAVETKHTDLEIEQQTDPANQELPEVIEKGQQLYANEQSNGQTCLSAKDSNLVELANEKSLESVANLNNFAEDDENKENVAPTDFIMSATDDKENVPPSTGTLQGADRMDTFATSEIENLQSSQGARSHASETNSDLIPMDNNYIDNGQELSDDSSGDDEDGLKLCMESSQESTLCETVPSLSELPSPQKLLLSSQNIPVEINQEGSSLNHPCDIGDTNENSKELTMEISKVISMSNAAESSHSQLNRMEMMQEADGSSCEIPDELESKSINDVSEGYPELPPMTLSKSQSDEIEKINTNAEKDCDVMAESKFDRDNQTVDKSQFSQTSSSTKDESKVENEDISGDEFNICNGRSEISGNENIPTLEVASMETNSNEKMGMNSFETVKDIFQKESENEQDITEEADNVTTPVTSQKMSPSSEETVTRTMAHKERTVGHSQEALKPIEYAIVQIQSVEDHDLDPDMNNKRVANQLSTEIIEKFVEKTVDKSDIENVESAYHDQDTSSITEGTELEDEIPELKLELTQIPQDETDLELQLELSQMPIEVCGKNEDIDTLECEKDSGKKCTGIQSTTPQMEICDMFSDGKSNKEPNGEIINELMDKRPELSIFIKSQNVRLNTPPISETNDKCQEVDIVEISEEVKINQEVYTCDPEHNQMAVNEQLSNVTLPILGGETADRYPDMEVGDIGSRVTDNNHTTEVKMVEEIEGEIRNESGDLFSKMVHQSVEGEEQQKLGTDEEHHRGDGCEENHNVSIDLDHHQMGGDEENQKMSTDEDHQVGEDKENQKVSTDEDHQVDEDEENQKVRTDEDHQVGGNKENQKVSTDEDHQVDEDKENQKVRTDEDHQVGEDKENQKVSTDEDQQVDGDEENQNVSTDEEDQQVNANEENQKVSTDEDHQVGGDEENRKVSLDKDHHQLDEDEENQKVSTDEDHQVGEDKENQKVSTDEDQQVNANEENQKVSTDEDHQVGGDEENQTDEDHHQMDADEEYHKVSTDVDHQVDADEEYRKVSLDKDHHQVDEDEENHEVSLDKDHHQVDGEENCNVSSDKHQNVDVDEASQKINMESHASISHVLISKNSSVVDNTNMCAEMVPGNDRPGSVLTSEDGEKEIAQEFVVVETGKNDVEVQGSCEGVSIVPAGMEHNEGSIDDKTSSFVVTKKYIGSPVKEDKSELEEIYSQRETSSQVPSHKLSDLDHPELKKNDNLLTKNQLEMDAVENAVNQTANGKTVLFSKNLENTEDRNSAYNTETLSILSDDHHDSKDGIDITLNDSVMEMATQKFSEDGEEIKADLDTVIQSMKLPTLPKKSGKVDQQSCVSETDEDKTAEDNVSTFENPSDVSISYSDSEVYNADSEVYNAETQDIVTSNLDSEGDKYLNKTVTDADQQGKAGDLKNISSSQADMQEIALFETSEVAALTELPQISHSDKKDITLPSSTSEVEVSSELVKNIQSDKQEIAAPSETSHVEVSTELQQKSHSDKQEINHPPEISEKEMSMEFPKNSQTDKQETISPSETSQVKVTTELPQICQLDNKDVLSLKNSDVYVSTELLESSQSDKQEVDLPPETSEVEDSTELPKSSQSDKQEVDLPPETSGVEDSTELPKSSQSDKQEVDLPPETSEVEDSTELPKSSQSDKQEVDLPPETSEVEDSTELPKSSQSDKQEFDLPPETSEVEDSSELPKSSQSDKQGVDLPPETSEVEDSSELPKSSQSDKQGVDLPPETSGVEDSTELPKSSQSDKQEVDLPLETSEVQISSELPKSSQSDKQEVDLPLETSEVQISSELPKSSQSDKQEVDLPLETSEVQISSELPESSQSDKQEVDLPLETSEVEDSTELPKSSQSDKQEVDLPLETSEVQISSELLESSQSDKQETMAPTETSQVKGSTDLPQSCKSDKKDIISSMISEVEVAIELPTSNQSDKLEINASKTPKVEVSSELLQSSQSDKQEMVGPSVTSEVEISTELPPKSLSESNQFDDTEDGQFDDADSDDDYAPPPTKRQCLPTIPYTTPSPRRYVRRFPLSSSQSPLPIPGCHGTADRRSLTLGLVSPKAVKRKSDAQQQLQPAQSGESKRLKEDTSDPRRETSRAQTSVVGERKNELSPQIILESHKRKHESGDSVNEYSEMEQKKTKIYSQDEVKEYESDRNEVPFLLAKGDGQSLDMAIDGSLIASQEESLYLYLESTQSCGRSSQSHGEDGSQNILQNVSEKTKNSESSEQDSEKSTDERKGKDQDKSENNTQQMEKQDTKGMEKELLEFVSKDSEEKDNEKSDDDSELVIALKERKDDSKDDEDKGNSGTSPTSAMGGNVSKEKGRGGGRCVQERESDTQGKGPGKEGNKEMSEYCCSHDDDALCDCSGLITEECVSTDGESGAQKLVLSTEQESNIGINKDETSGPENTDLQVTEAEATLDKISQEQVEHTSLLHHEEPDELNVTNREKENTVHSTTEPCAGPHYSDLSNMTSVSDTTTEDVMQVCSLSSQLEAVENTVNAEPCQDGDKTKSDDDRDMDPVLREEDDLADPMLSQELYTQREERSSWVCDETTRMPVTEEMAGSRTSSQISVESVVSCLPQEKETLVCGVELEQIISTDAEGESSCKQSGSVLQDSLDEGSLSPVLPVYDSTNIYKAAEPKQDSHVMTQLSCAFDDDDEFVAPQVDFECLMSQDEMAEAGPSRMPGDDDFVGAIRDKKLSSGSSKSGSDHHSMDSIKEMISNSQDTDSEEEIVFPSLMPGSRAMTSQRPSTASSPDTSMDDADPLSMPSRPARSRSSLSGGSSMDDILIENSQTDRKWSRVSDVLEKHRLRQLIKHERLESSQLSQSQGTPEKLPPEGVTRQQVISSHSKMTVDNAENYMNRAKRIIKSLETLLGSRRDLQHHTRIQAWLKSVNELKTKASFPSTVVAVVGDTGSGKSSLMNALLDHSNILPTSGMRACTAVVAEINNNTKNNNYEGEITFLTKKEWYAELKLLLSELTGKDGKVKAYEPNPQSQPDAAAAWYKIRAVYGHFKDGVTFEQLARRKTVTQKLGEVMKITHRKPQHFRQKVNSFIQSANNRGDGEQFWPIVKKVSIYIPKCDVLGSGATLVDLPGVRDSNAARDNIAREFLKSCTAVWVVADISRAVDNKTAKEMLGEHFRRQLLMDGQYGAISFICTKTDLLMTSELIEPLKLEEAVEPTNIKIDGISQQMEPLKEDIELLDGEIEDKQQQICEMQQEYQDLKEQLANIINPEGSDNEDDVDEEAQMEAMEVLRQDNLLIQLVKDEITAKQRERREKHKMVLELEKEIESHHRSIAIMCAHARNEYSQRQIKRDFKAGLREMKRSAGLEEELEEEYESSEEEDNEDEDIACSAEKLEVFCVSSTDYLKIKGLRPKEDGPPNIFRTLDETCIPKLKDFVYNMTYKRKLQSSERMLELLNQGVSDIFDYLTDQGTMDSRLRRDVKDIIDCQLEVTRKEILSPMIDNVRKDMDGLFDKSLTAKVKEGVTNAKMEAGQIQAKWGAKVNKDCKEAGGLHWSTYKAVVRRDGVYNSPSNGNINFNEDLTAPVYNSITISWDRIFNAKLLQLLDSFHLRIMKALKDFGEKLERLLVPVGIATDRLTRATAQMTSMANTKLGETIGGVRDFIQDRQREINRTLTPFVQRNMLPAYVGCTNEAGAGSFNRMKVIMADHVDTAKNYIFDEASTDLLDKLAILQNEILEQLSWVINEVAADVSALYEPFWETPSNTKMLRKAYLGGIIYIVSQIKSLLQDAGIDDLRPHSQPSAQGVPGTRWESESPHSATTSTGLSRLKTEDVPHTYLDQKYSIPAQQQESKPNIAGVLTNADVKHPQGGSTLKCKLSRKRCWSSTAEEEARSHVKSTKSIKLEKIKASPSKAASTACSDCGMKVKSKKPCQRCGHQRGQAGARQVGTADDAASTSVAYPRKPNIMIQGQISTNDSDRQEVPLRIVSTHSLNKKHQREKVRMVQASEDILSLGGKDMSVSGVDPVFAELVAKLVESQMKNQRQKEVVTVKIPEAGLLNNASVHPQERSGVQTSKGGTLRSSPASSRSQSRLSLSLKGSPARTANVKTEPGSPADLNKRKKPEDYGLIDLTVDSDTDSDESLPDISWKSNRNLRS